jgi:hypothetical protein
MCNGDQQWTEALAKVLLRIRNSYKADLQASAAELVYGEPLRISGELLTPAAGLAEPEHLITELRHHMARLRPVPEARHASPTTFVHKDLRDCLHVFLRQDATRRALEPHYSGPYQVLSRREKRLQILVRGKPVTVSADLGKPAYVLDETSHGSPTSNSPDTGSATYSCPDYTLRQPRTLPRTLNHLKISAGVLWGHAHKTIFEDVFILSSRTATVHLRATV